VQPNTRLKKVILSGEVMINTQIGSDFELPFGHLLWRKQMIEPGVYNNGSRYLLTSRGRGSIRLVLNKLITIEEGSEALLPAYLFKGLLLPFKEKGMIPRYYKLNPDLSMDIADIKSKISNNTRILYIIHYFGFPQAMNNLTWVRQEFPNCIIIEDLAQALGSACIDESLGTFGDFSFNNLIKFGAFPDGSILTINNNMSSQPQYKSDFVHTLYVITRYLAMMMKSVYLKTRLFPQSFHRFLFRYSNQLAERHPLRSGMSCISKRLLQREDFEKLVLKRRHNYHYLLGKWSSQILLPIYETLPDKVCPFGFIVLADERDRIVKELCKNGIYCPIQWSPNAQNEFEALPDELDSDDFPVSKRIARTIIMIPIDQRYGDREMDHILEKVDQLSINKLAVRKGVKQYV
jgi:dTDP-4-amino-4,6-dideoxygalactose transaminase